MPGNGGDVNRDGEIAAVRASMEALKSDVEAAVREVFDMRPAAIIDRLDLRRPIFKRTAAYGHFGRVEGDGFTWENTAPYAEQLKAAAASA